jgi:hypothetical protein
VIDWYQAGYEDGYYAAGYDPPLLDNLDYDDYRAGYLDGADDFLCGC